LQSAGGPGSVGLSAPDMIRSASSLALVALTACSAQTAQPVTSAPTLPAAQPPPLAAPSPVTAQASTDASATPSASPSPPPPSAEASAVDASAPPSTGVAPAAPESAPLPRVAIANIGMHIGGGPNDDVTKDPIRRSVQPHFDEFRRCFAQVEDAHKAGDFGVDLRIDRAGGKARVSHPRSALKGKEFKACVVSTFESIDFLKPRGGTTTVSYSLRFTPAQGGSDDGGSAPKPPRP
jgi:hypothetical protein